jgi:ubiquitin-like protein ATG12
MAASTTTTARNENQDDVDVATTTQTSALTNTSTPVSPPTTTTTTTTTTTAVPSKIKVHFVSVGSAPILKKTKFQIASSERFSSVHVFLRKMVRSQDELFLYVSQSFSPSPDMLLSELYGCFKTPNRDELIIHYSLQPAWG